MPFAPDSNVEVINVWGNDDTFLAKRTRATSTTRYTIEVKSEPLLVTFDDTLLGAGVATAIKDLIQTQIEHITEHASKNTQMRRQRAAVKFAQGDPATLRHYSGGRMGPMPPNPDSRTLFNDSGRLAQGLAVMQNKTDATFTINVPKNRLDPTTFKDQGSFVKMVDKLISLVPALDAQKLGNYKDIENAVREGIRMMIQKGEMAGDARMVRLLKQKAAMRNKALAAAARLFFRGITGRI